MKSLFLMPKNWFKILIPVFVLMYSTGCKDDPDPVSPTPVASFQFEIDETDFLTVQFSNFSLNATSYSWDFGDGNSSTEQSPSHTYSEAGDYTVTLTARNADGMSATRSESFSLSDPNSAIKTLTGETSKTWDLFREGISMSVGPNAYDPAGHWAGLANDGSRPCLYFHEFIFHSDGTYEFDDKGEFWTEFGVFNNNSCTDKITPEACIESTDANLVNSCGNDVSAWRSGKHTFEYDAATSTLTLNGEGAWIGNPKLGTNGETIVPVSSVSAKVTIEEFTGYDVMLVEFIYDGNYWPIRYAHYTDLSLKPDVVTDAPEPMEFGEDLPDVTPTELSLSFLNADTANFRVPPSSGSFVTYEVPDPAGSMDLVGEFIRTEAQFQEFQLQTSPESDINFANLSTIDIEVYFPSANDYSGALTKNVIIGFGDLSATERWWEDIQQYEADDSGFAEDEWIPISFDLDSPTFVSNTGNGSTPKERTDFDMIFIRIGGNDHTKAGNFYVRNFSIK